jgi:predicted ATPase
LQALVGCSSASWSSRESERCSTPHGSMGDGSVLVVEGPAGIGKTRLSRAARQEAELRDCVTPAARGAELEREYAFGVVRQLFESMLRSASTAEGADDRFRQSGL